MSLNIFRHCSVGTSDLDFSVDLSWWTSNNSKVLSDMLVEKDYKKLRTFGKPDSFGYEESWVKDTVKVDIFSSVVQAGVHSIGQWVEGKLYSCSYPLAGVQEVTVPVWEGRKVRLPSPVEPVLVAMYGPNWRHPVTEWRWDVDPFLTGYCRY